MHIITRIISLKIKKMKKTMHMVKIFIDNKIIIEKEPFLFLVIK